MIFITLIGALLFLGHGLSMSLELQDSNQMIRRGKQQEDLMMDCGTSYKIRNDRRVIIESPNFGTDEPYPPMVDCKWRIQGECLLEVSCQQFHLNDIICMDSLSIWNSTNWQKEFCGNGPKKFTGGKDMIIRFKSDPVLNLPHKGFQCSVYCSPNSVQENDIILEPSEYDCDCGAVRNSRRVVNGETIESNEFPWMAGIIHKQNSFPICGGSLISSRHVLTAAHCVTNAEPEELKVVFTNFQSHTYAAAAEITRHVKTIHEHPNFTYYLDYDAAILQLDEAIPLDDKHMWNVCLPGNQRNGLQIEGSEATACGWGRLDTYGPLADQLQQANLTIMSEEECATYYKEPGAITPRMLCTYSELRNVCEGDSGGPLMTRIDEEEYERFLLVGVTSWGAQSGCLGMPAVFTRVGEILPWIYEVIGKERGCRDMNL